MRQKMLGAWGEFGITQELYHAAERRAVERNQGLYTLDGHIAELFNSADRAKALSAAIVALEHLTDCLYSDVVPWLQTHTADRLTVLTFGDAQWQRQKIVASGVEEYVAEVIITQGSKETWPSQLTAESDMLIVDDKAQHLDEIAAVCPSAQLYWMQRPGTPHTQVPAARHTLIHSLEDINF